MKAFFLTLLVALQVNSAAQGRFDVSAGLDFPEFINIGATYQIQQTQIGVAYGFWPFILNEKVTTFSGDIDYHFGEFSDYSTLRSWFVRLGIIYLRDNYLYGGSERYGYLHARFGKDIPISKKWESA